MTPAPGITLLVSRWCCQALARDTLCGKVREERGYLGEGPEVDGGPGDVHHPGQAHWLPLQEDNNKHSGCWIWIIHLIPALCHGQLFQPRIDPIGYPQEVTGPDLEDAQELGTIIIIVFTDFELLCGNFEHEGKVMKTFLPSKMVVS